MSIIANFDINLRGNTEGIDTAAEKTSGTMDGLAKKVETTTTLIGGTLGTFLGGPIGTAIGAAVGGMVGRVTSAVAGAFDSTREQLSSIVMEGSEEAKGVAASYGSAWEQITSSASEAWEKVSEAAKPVLTLIGDGFTAVAGQIVRVLQPVLSWAASFAEGTFFTFQAVLEAVTEAIKPVWEWLVKIVDKWVEASEQWPDGGEIAIKALRGIAVAGAYAYDSIKALAGAAMFVAGKMVEHLGPPVLSALIYLTNGLEEVFKAILKLADAARDSAMKIVEHFGKTASAVAGIVIAINSALLDSGSKWFEETSAKLDKLKEDAKKLGDSMSKTGGDMLLSFGDSAKRVRTFFDDVLERYKHRTKSKKEEADEDEKGFKANRAVERGSVEAFRIIADGQGDKMYEVANKQLEVQQKTLEELRKRRQGPARQPLGKAQL